MSDDEKRPQLYLAADNELPDVRRKRAELDLEWPLKQLAANMLRIVRGAGKPYEVGQQCARVIDAYHKYRATVGEWPPSHVIGEILSIRYRENRAKTDRAIEWEDAKQQMIAGGLQAAASQILGQLTQERAGESEMFDGLRVIERQREENRAAASASKPKKPTKPAVKGRGKPVVL